MNYAVTKIRILYSPIRYQNDHSPHPWARLSTLRSFRSREGPLLSTCLERRTSLLASRETRVDSSVIGFMRLGVSRACGLTNSVEVET